MRSLKEKIDMKLFEGGFFKNVGTGLSELRDWFEKVPVTFSQYLTKWDEKHIVKDSNTFTITFKNLYKRDHDKKDVILDLWPYMEQLIEIDPEHIYIDFATGLYHDNIKINNTEKKAKDDANPNFYGWDKKIRISIMETTGANPHPEKQIINGNDVNKMVSLSRGSWYSSASRRHNAYKNNSRLLLCLEQYTDDFPFQKDGWTVITNNLEK